MHSVCFVCVDLFHNQTHAHPTGFQARSTIITTGDSQDCFHTSGAVVVNNHLIAGIFSIQSDGKISEDNSEFIPDDWGLAANKKGSMTLQVFVKFCEWFVEYILKPRGYGRGQKASILVFDGHASRWDYAGIMWLLANNCWPFCEPARASRWAQVGDNATNAMIRAGLSHFYGVWCNKYDGLRTFDRNDYNWCYVQTINRINERMMAELLDNPLPKPPPPPTRRNRLVYAPTTRPDGTDFTIKDLMNIPADTPEDLRPDRNLVQWLDMKENQAVEAMCSDLDSIKEAYCRTIPPVRESAITTLSKKYRTEDKQVLVQQNHSQSHSYKLTRTCFASYTPSTSVPATA